MRNSIKALAVTAGLVFSGSVFAQTCASPATWTPDATGAPVQNGTTCGGEDSVSLYCGALDSAGKPDTVYRLTFAAAGPQRTATQIAVAGGAAGFTPVAVLYSDGCATADACTQSGDPTAPLPLASVPAGTYFLAVSAASFEAAGACGAFTLTANGTFPVSLQNFSVE